jgi:cysteine-rich repeat protein
VDEDNGPNEACTNLCRAQTCGNGVVEADEDCDDGNQINTDNCTNSCLSAECGDGIVQVGLGEECDDANDDNNDSCTEVCDWNVCGDGVRYTTVTDPEGNPSEVEGCDGGQVPEGVTNDAWDDSGSAGICTDTCQVQCFGGVSGRAWAGEISGMCVFVAEATGDNTPALFDEPAMGSQAEAEAACDAFGVGAKLVKIANATKQSFVAARLNAADEEADAWTGLIDNSAETSVVDKPGDWFWTADGAAVTYTNWLTDEPNNGGEGDSEDCGTMQSGGFWNDAECESDFHVICEFPHAP